MNLLTLELNGLPADLPAKQAGLIKLQRSLAALADLETRTGEYSWPLTLPPTQRNALIFGATALHTQGLDKFTTSYAFVLSTATGQQWRGLFRLSASRSADGYTGSLFMEGFSWATALAGKTLPQLKTLRPLAYDGTQLETILGQDCETNDVQFPLLSFGNFYAPPRTVIGSDGQPKEVPVPAAPELDYPLAVDDYYPACYYVNVIRAIFREAGFYAQGPCLDSDADVRSWLITAAGSAADGWPWGLLLPSSASAVVPNSPYSNFGLVTALGPAYGNNAAGFDTIGDIFFLPVGVPVIGHAPTNALNPVTSTYTAPRAGTYGFSWSALIANGGQELTNPLGFSGNDPGFQAVVIGLVASRGGESLTGGDGGICTPGQGFPTPLQQRVVDYHFLSNANDATLATGSFGSTAPVSVFLEAGDQVRLCVFARRTYTDANGHMGRTRRFFFVTINTAAFACVSYVDNDGLSQKLLQPAGFLPPLAQVDTLRDFLLRTNTVPVVDIARRTVTLLSRADHSLVQGDPIELSDYSSPRASQYLPVLQAAANIVFSPAPAENDALAPPRADVVTLVMPGDRAGADKAVPFSFAPTGARLYRLPGGYTVSLPTAASVDDLKIARSDVSWQVSSVAPRVLRYRGIDLTLSRIPFNGRQLCFGRSDYAGSIALNGPTGVVATRYAALIESAVRGHLLRLQLPLSAWLYQQLAPGRRVWVFGAEYTVEALTGFDPANASGTTQLDLLRLV